MAYKRYYRQAKWFDYESSFRRVVGDPNTIILNHIPIHDPDYVENFADKIYSKGDQTEFISSCACGHLTGKFFEGRECPKCYSVVSSDMEVGRDGYPLRTWLETPPQIPKGWLHPIAYRMVRNWTNIKGNKTDKSYLDILLDPDFPVEDIPPEMKQLASEGRGFTFLHDNWKRFIDTVLTIPKYTKDKKKRKQTARVLEVLHKFKHLLWIRHTPVLHSSLHALIAPESMSGKTKSYTDKNSRHIKQIASVLNHIQFEDDEMPIYRMNKMIYQAYKSLIEYTMYISGVMIDKKEGLARQHCFGERHHWSIRGVITPLTGAHDIEEVHIPYVAMVELMRIELMGRLVLEKGYSHKEATHKYNTATVTFDEEIYELLCRFVKDCRYPGIPFFFNRPPTVRPGSLQLVWATHIKRNIHDKTIGMSPYGVGPFNAEISYCVSHGRFAGLERNLQSVLLELQEKA